MIQYDARKKAHSLWARYGRNGYLISGCRRGFTRLRTKKSSLRFEVGYSELTTDHKWITVIVGAGASLEDAFAQAERTP